MKAPIQALLAGLVLAGPAHAQADNRADAPATTLSFNAALTSDYRYRGISQTRLRPALQGGVDVTHTPSGLYAGAWASTIRWTRDAGGDGDIELDLYAGKRGELPGALSYDLGVLRYLYPDNGLGQVRGFASAHTTELYVQLGMGPAYLKYSQATTNLFGFVDSEDSGYLDLGANFALSDSIGLQVHAGRQRVRGNPAADYSDWKIGLTRQYALASVALAYVGTNAGRGAYASPANGKHLGRDALQLTLSRTF